MLRSKLRLTIPTTNIFPCVVEETRRTITRQQICHLKSDKICTNKSKILNYLRQGEEISITFGFDRDLFTNELICPPNDVTDGVWHWSTILPYYIEKYNITISEEFVIHMESNNWQCPTITDYKFLIPYYILNEKEIDSFVPNDFEIDLFNYETMEKIIESGNWVGFESHDGDDDISYTSTRINAEQYKKFLKQQLRNWIVKGDDWLCELGWGDIKKQVK
jgi:hypothetical protein